MTKKINRFLAKVTKTDSCWLWNGYLTPSGYGTFWMDRTNYRANRASYLLFKGEIPPDKLVCHTCHNRACVNPEHRYLGTHQDNMDDRTSSGRARKTKLTKEQLSAIRNDPRPQRKIAAEYGMAMSHVWRIKNGFIRG